MATANEIFIDVRARYRDAQEGLQKIAEEVGLVGDQINKLAATAGIIAGVGTAILGVSAAIVKMSTDVGADVEQLDRLSRSTGVSIQNLQIMRRAMIEGGGDFAGLTNAIGFLNRAIGNNSETLKRAGITTRDAFEAALQLGRGFAASGDAALNAAVAQKVLGRGNKEVIADFQTLVAIAPQVAQQIREAGLSLDPGVVDAALKVNKEMNRLTRTWEDSWAKMKVATLPAGIAILGTLNDIIATIQRGIPLTQLFTTSLAKTFSVGRPTFFPAHASTLGGPPGTTPDLRPPPEPSFQFTLPTLFKAALEENTKAIRELTARVTPQRPGAPTFTPSGAVEQTAPRFLPIDQVLGDFRAFTRETLDGASILRDTLGQIWASMQSQLHAAFESMKIDAQLFSNVVKAVFAALRQAIIGEIARIASSLIVSGIVQLIGRLIPGGGPILSGLVGAGAGATAAPGASNATTNVTINALDSRSINDAFRSGGGAFATYQRRAQARSGF